MKGSRDYRDYFKDIIVETGRIMEFTEGMNYDDFAADAKTVYAVIRSFEIIGEAVKKYRRRYAASIQAYHGKKSLECVTSLSMNILEPAFPSCGKP